MGSQFFPGTTAVISPVDLCLAAPAKAWSPTLEGSYYSASGRKIGKSLCRHGDASKKWDLTAILRFANQGRQVSSPKLAILKASKDCPQMGFCSQAEQVPSYLLLGHIYILYMEA